MTGPGVPTGTLPGDVLDRLTPVTTRPAASPDLKAAIQALDAAQPGYMKAAAYYSGQIAEVFASVRLRRAMARTGMSFVFNFARLAVDAVAERLALSAVTAEPSPASDALGELWKRNRMKLTAKTIMRNALKYGDAYALVWPDPDDEHQVDIFYNSPLSVRLFYDRENPRKKSYAAKRWQMPDKTIRIDLYYPDRVEKYRQIGKGQQATWVQWTDDPGDDWPYAHALGEIPVFHFRTDEPYGHPEHAGFYGPQDAIHKLIISHMASVDYQAYPQRYALRDVDSDSMEAGDSDEDEFAFASQSGSTEPAAEGRSQLQADPGSLWDLVGYKSVGEFATAAPDNFTNPMMIYLRMGAQITNTPLYRIDPSGSIPSGDSRRVAEAPFVAKCRDRADSFEDAWQELVTFATQVAGPTAASVDVQWKPMQSVDDLEGWQVIAAKLDAGLPVQQVFAEAGYTDEQIAEWFGEEVDDLPVAVELLGKIASALASLGTAVSLGAVSDAQVQALIASIIGDPDNDGVADILDPDDVGPKAEEMAAQVEAHMLKMAGGAPAAPGPQPLALAPPPPDQPPGTS